MDWSRVFDAFKEGVVAFVGVAVGVFITSMFLPFGFIRRRMGLIEFTNVLLYDAHNPLATLAIAGSNLFALIPTNPVTLVTVLLPPVVLFFQGRELVGDDSSADGASGLAVRGALVVVGYAPVALLGAVSVLDVISTADVAFTAVVYPLVFGGIGGVSTEW